MCSMNRQCPRTDRNLTPSSGSFQAESLATISSIAAAGPVLAAASWETITGNIQWSCNGLVETWDTWQAEYAGGEATGTTTDFLRHVAGTCPSGATVAWKAVTGDIQWPCSGKETWSTWEEEVVDGQATGGTRNVVQHSAGNCAAAGSSGSGTGNSGSTSVQPPSVTLAPVDGQPISASSGPSAGEVAVGTTGRCVVARSGQVIHTLPACAWVQWVPGSEWVVYEQVGAPPDTSPLGYYAMPIGGSSPIALPCSGGSVRSVQAIPGPAVAYDCNGELTILPLGTASQAKSYSWAKLPQAAFAVDPTQTYVAITTPQGWVNVYRLADGSQLAGTYMAGDPQAMAWSAKGVLAIDSSEGITLWRPGTSVLTVPQVANENLLAWLPDGSAVLALSAMNSASRGYQVDLAGTAKALAPNASEEVLGLTADGTSFWYDTANVQPATIVYTLTAAATGV